TSGLYAYAVAVARVVNKANVGLRVTVVESGAALDNLRRVREGVFDLALMVDVPSAMQMYRGIEAFKGQPWEPLRFLIFRNVIHDRVYVRADSGIKSFSGIAGKRFCPGLPGSSS
ncbi:MAG: TAXI family TRAP transporter solute-binding subunit, partial [candidate division WOR-3 bacterium]